MASRGRAFAAGALFLLLELALQGAAEPPLVPAMFVFGDSLVDVGNNNHLARCNASCRADYPRYGVDHPCHSPTGRFSNGYNLADQLAQLLGFPESPPPLLSLLKARLVPQMSSGGINFASGGAGLLDRTGPRVCGGEVLSMTAQVGNFTSLARRWRRENRTTAADLISRSLFFISVGSNDLFEHIAFPSAPNRNDIRFLQDLVASYTSYIKDLYAAGARKFSVVSPSLVGCCPSQRALAHDPSKGPIGVDKFGCLGAANNLSRQLHPMVADMLQGLSLELPRMNYSLGDAVGMADFVFNSPSTPAYNFTELERACCGSGEFGEGGCNGSAPLCGNRSSYVFWDRFHPTEAASAVTAKELFVDTGLFVRPINVQQLVAPQP
ncbi:hypothetical protein GQ55_7G245100 [Panicum hallii var. hallii]|uniref:GDSL esterase/lipase n=1 Tax=Panicum hallii var. hallii TaxID=1504633 RepID=A0A2T7CYM2_9POAL|nr:hypothetical protein GQ55_7G245100 [Panicum hallii var. hallii]